jgi:hypothetical protein
MKSEVNDNHWNDGTGDDSNNIVEVDHNQGKGPRRKCNNVNDDCGLHHGLGLDFRGNFHALSNGDGGEERGELEEGGSKGARAKWRNPGTVPMAEVTVTSPQRFVVRAQKSAERK